MSTEYILFDTLLYSKINLFTIIIGAGGGSLNLFSDGN